MAHAVTRGVDIDMRTDKLGDGLSVGAMLTGEQGAVHLEAAVCELAPGGSVPGHLHAFEESFYVERGRAIVVLGDITYEVGPGDFGFAPIATPHAWRNTGDEPVVWLRTRSPMARRIGSSRGTYHAGVNAPDEGRTVSELDPSARFVGHFDDGDLPAPGPLSMPGYHGPNVRNVAVRMMVDEILGARHHTLFVVEFAPSDEPTPSASQHFHPFEEFYWFVSGHARGEVGGDPVDPGPGDLVFAGVNVSHGFTTAGDVPVRWIEAQAPMPPSKDGFFFEDDWLRLTPVGDGG